LILHETDVRTKSEVSPDRRGVSRRTVLEEAKAKVATIDLADRLAGAGKMRRIGAEWATNCLLPDHEDRTPSFTVNTEKDVWFCYGCLRGGDVIELARFAWGYEKSEVAMAAADLLHEFGYEIPGRPASWYRKQERQDPVRRELERSKGRLVQRRLYRWFYAPRIRLFEDEEERLEEARIAWEECALLARLLVEGGRKP
jgi:DNA primase